MVKKLLARQLSPLWLIPLFTLIALGGFEIGLRYNPAPVTVDLQCSDPEASVSTY